MAKKAFTHSSSSSSSSPLLESNGTHNGSTIATASENSVQNSNSEKNGIRIFGQWLQYEKKREILEYPDGSHGNSKKRKIGEHPDGSHGNSKKINEEKKKRKIGENPDGFHANSTNNGSSTTTVSENLVQNNNPENSIRIFGQILRYEKKKKRKIGENPDGSDGKSTNNGKFGDYTPEVQAVERRLEVSTVQRRYQDPWKIKKTLYESDVNSLCRLMLGTKTVEDHILGEWDEERRAGVVTGAGVTVKVWDKDTETEHESVFKWWRSSGSFVFTRKWKARFVNRRGLKVGDQIGLFWDPVQSRFWFSVLARAAALPG